MRGRQKKSFLQSEALKIFSQDLVKGDLFVSADKEHFKKERQKAKELKKTRWWKDKLNKGECYYCGQNFKKENLSMDHIVPLAREGRTIKRNVVVSCKQCNFKKKHKTLVEIRLNK